MINRLTWIKYPSINNAALLSSNTPGVYAIGTSRNENNLPVAFNWAYIGRSDNLQRRLNEHQIRNEKNSALKEWMTSHFSDLEVWVAMTTKSSSRDVERNLIKKLKPHCNKLYI